MAEKQESTEPRNVTSENELMATILCSTKDNVSDKVKLFASMLSLNEPLRWKLEMVIAIKENRPFDFVEIVNSHTFSQDDVLLVAVLAECAMSMVQAMPMHQYDNSSLITSPFSTVAKQPKVACLSNYVRGEIRKFLKDNKGNMSGVEKNFYAESHHVPVQLIEKYCDRYKRKEERAILRDIFDIL